MSLAFDRLVSTYEKLVDSATNELQYLLPAGGARNALDLALWDLECKILGKTIWQLTEITPKPIATVYTLGIEDTISGNWAQKRFFTIKVK